MPTSLDTGPALLCTDGISDRHAESAMSSEAPPKAIHALYICPPSPRWGKSSSAWTTCLSDRVSAVDPARRNRAYNQHRTLGDLAVSTLLRIDRHFSVITATCTLTRSSSACRAATPRCACACGAR